MIYRVMTVLAVLFASPVIAQGGPGSRVSVTYQTQGAAERSKATSPGNVLGAFGTDPDAPIHIEADKVVDVFEGSQSIFTGDVTLRQGDFLLRTFVMTSYHSGKTGLSDAPDGAPAQLTRIEARERVLVKSKDGQTATGDWAIFDVKANTVLMGDQVVVSRGKDVAQGPRLKIDLTTGMYRFEIDSGPSGLQPPGVQMRKQ